MSRTRTNAGFTLIEIMAVVLIIGLLSALVGIAVIPRIEQGQVAAARAQLNMLDAALETGDSAALVAELCTATDAVVQVGGGLRDDDAVAAVLDAGADRAIVGTRAVDDRAWLGTVAERWPGYRETIRRAANLQNMAHEQLVAMPLPQTRTAVGESALAIDTSIDAPRLAAQIYQWLASDEAPDRRRLLEFARQALDARADRIPELNWSGECLRVWAGMVIRVIEPDPGEAWPQQLVVGEPHHGPWGTYNWEVSDRPDHGLPAGLPLAVVPAFSVPELKLPNRPRKAIGKCLQEFRIPPWWRRYLPVLYYKNDAVWAVNIGPLAGWESQAKQTGGATFLPVWGPRGTL